MREKTGANFDDHHHAGNGNDDARSAFAFREIAHEIVRMAKPGMICPMHLLEDSAIIAASANKALNSPTMNLPKPRAKQCVSRYRDQERTESANDRRAGGQIPPVGQKQSSDSANERN